MNNRTKWLIALPFTLCMGLILPGLIAGRIFWFLQSWGDTFYIFFTFSMWLIATAFVDVSARKIERDLPRSLLSLGVILAVPAAVIDRVYGPAASFSVFWSFLGLIMCLIAAGLGIAARLTLGRFYAPHPAIGQEHELIMRGPYRIVRHPLYLAALLWGVGWPLLVRSVLGAVLLLALELPALLVRIRSEEHILQQTFGEAYTSYRQRTWLFLPFLY